MYCHSDLLPDLTGGEWRSSLIFALLVGFLILLILAFWLFLTMLPIPMVLLNADLITGHKIGS